MRGIMYYLSILEWFLLCSDEETIFVYLTYSCIHWPCVIALLQPACNSKLYHYIDWNIIYMHNIYICKKYANLNAFYVKSKSKWTKAPTDLYRHSCERCEIMAQIEACNHAECYLSWPCGHFILVMTMEVQLTALVQFVHTFCTECSHLFSTRIFTTHCIIQQLQQWSNKIQ
jgi:hypothetical protein